MIPTFKTLHIGGVEGGRENIKRGYLIQKKDFRRLGEILHLITFFSLLSSARPQSSSNFFLCRHEGRKMKQELRCHAVLCPSENKARLMAKRLKEKLHQALIDFKKEKVWRQNARLSLANAGDEQKTMPFRKIMLQAGGSNYRPPLEKGKSAPKLRVIEEVIVEEDEDLDEDEDTLTSDNIVVQVRQFFFL